MEPPPRLVATVAVLGLVTAAGFAASGCHARSGATGGTGGHGTGGHAATGTGAHGGAGTGTATDTVGTTSTGGGGGADPCSGVTCSGEGTCTVSAGQAACTCVAGYHAAGLTCVADEKCTPTTCGNCAMCEVMGGVAVCTCPDGYSLQGKDCQLTTDPCATTACGPTQACVSEAHCQPLGACVDTCDCSNCGNCGPDADWSTEQEYCGSGPSGPATMMCNVPCTGGQGCLPYNPPICWPLEGCFSQ